MKSLEAQVDIWVTKLQRGAQIPFCTGLEWALDCGARALGCIVGR